MRTAVGNEIKFVTVMLQRKRQVGLYNMSREISTSPRRYQW